MNVLLVNLAKMVGYSGGMQKVASSFANEMKRRGHQVSLVYSDIQTGEFFYPIDKGGLLMFAIIRGNPLLMHGI